MNKNKISILLPNYNYVNYLEQRIESILSQTYENFELIIVDSYSNDGAWELINKYAALDARIIASQAPRGLYESWNRCLDQATGDFVYIATSDDTMRNDAMETMIQLLETHPQCGICDSNLEAIDSEGKPLDDFKARLPITQYLANYIDKQHIRQWPHDFLLYFSGAPVYTSITQLLVRKSLIDRCGRFSTRWGTKCDYEWGMKLASLSSTIYTPQKLASWRIHDNQVTSTHNADQNSFRHTWNKEMANSALNHLFESNKNLTAQQRKAFLKEIQILNALSYADTLKTGKPWNYPINFAKMVKQSPPASRQLVFNKFASLLAKKPVDLGTKLMKSIGIKNHLTTLIELESNTTYPTA